DSHACVFWYAIALVDSCVGSLGYCSDQFCTPITCCCGPCAVYCVSSSCLVRICSLFFFFFFFQAEDGIRDWSVTGVQTCALPIYHVEQFGAAGKALALDPQVVLMDEPT